MAIQRSTMLPSKCGIGKNGSKLSFTPENAAYRVPGDQAGELCFGADGPDHHVLTLHSADAPGLHHFAFEVASSDDLDRAADELAALGLPIVSPPTSGLEPGVARAMRFCDPEGNLVELIAGVDTIHQPYGNRDVKPVGLNHIVLEAKDRVALESFYRDTLGFQLTDQLAD